MVHRAWVNYKYPSPCSHKMHSYLDELVSKYPSLTRNNTYWKVCWRSLAQFHLPSTDFMTARPPTPLLFGLKFMSPSNCIHYHWLSFQSRCISCPLRSSGIQVTAELKVYSKQNGICCLRLTSHMMSNSSSNHIAQNTINSQSIQKPFTRRLPFLNELSFQC